MKARKHVLVVAADAAPLCEAARTLEPEEFDLIRATTAVEAKLLLESNAQLSLMAVDRSLIDDHDEFLRNARDHHKSLPVLWTRPGDAKIRFAVEPPNAYLDEPFDAAMFREKTRSLIVDDSFPRQVVHGLLSAGNAVLATTCEVAVEAGEPWLKQTGALEGDVHAYISFFGPDVSGHLISSGSLATLCALGERLGFDPEEGQRQVATDMAGEIANQVLGKMKLICGNALRDIRLGIPVIWVASNPSTVLPTDKPSLYVDMTTEDGAVHLLFGFSTLRVEDPTGGMDDGHMHAGEVQLF